MSHHSRANDGVIAARTNCFAINRLPQKTYFNYKVVFKPEVKNVRKRYELISALQTRIEPQVFSPKGIYDGNAAFYVSHELRFPSGLGGLISFLLPISNRPGSEQVTIEFTRTIGEPILPNDLDTLIISRQSNGKTATATQLLQLLIKQTYTNKEGYAETSRAFFIPEGKLNIGSGLELWRGFFQSVRSTLGKMLVNIDTTMSAVYQSGPLMDIAAEYLRIRNARDLVLGKENPNFHRLSNFLRNLRITYTNRPGQQSGVRVIKELIPSAGTYRFEGNDGIETTVYDYYLSAYNRRLEYPNIIGVSVAAKSRRVVIPIELCNVLPGQLYKKKLDADMTRKAVQFSTMNPVDRLKKIATSDSNATTESPIAGYATSEWLQEAGMEVCPDPLSIKGRLLRPPPLEYQGKSLVQPDFGAWNLRSQKFVAPQQLTSWGILNLVLSFKQESQLRRLSDGMTQSWNNLGMKLHNPTSVKNGNPQAVEKALDDIYGDVKRVHGKVQLLVVFVPKHGDDVRARIKHWGDVVTGVQTQCLKEEKLVRANEQYWANVALKINARLGGSNSFVKSPALDNLRSAPFMIIGIDVSHPSPGSSRPSVASCVWSHDIQGGQYASFTRLQHPRLEMIDELQEMVTEALTLFNKKHSRFPVRIVVYRDGVSDGELETVKTTEIGKFKNAFDVLRKRDPSFPDIKLTFIVVGKRHHIVFFPNPSDSRSKDKTGNLRAGFVTVDGLVNPTFNDFYLQSHAAVKGTSRSSHYVVLHDEIFNNDLSQIQDLSFALCHVYAKATRSVSIPAPVYYADLVCSREAFHYDPESDIRHGSDASTTGEKKSAFDLEKWRSGYKPIHRNLDKTMYFL